MIATSAHWKTLLIDSIQQLLLSSPRNNLEAHEALFKQTKCRTLLGPASHCQELSEACGIQHVEMLTMDQVLDTSKVEAYPWDRTFKDIASEPFVILHTSGSTGQPKMVEVTHALIATIDSQQDLPDVYGRCVTSRLWKDCKVYAAMPLFHSAGFNVLAFSIFQGTQPILGPSDQPPSIRTVEQILDMNVATAGLIPPSLLAEVVQEPKLLEKFSRWSSVSYGGGPLAEDAMKAIFQHTKILKLLGSTETFNLPELLPETEDELAYHYFHPSLGIDFRPEGSLHELVFVRREDPRHQGAFFTFPDSKEYHMKDLYERHPTKEGLWKYKGRLDDVVVLSNGEKFNPRVAEDVLASHTDVSTALILGSGREQPLLLVEPRASHTASLELDSTETLHRTNEILPDYAKIHSSHIHVAEAGSFLRSGKGEVRRGPTVDKLQNEIDSAYNAAENHISTNIRLDFRSTEDLATSLLATITSEILPGQEMNPTDDLFSHGFDSLAVMHLTRLIKASVRDQDVDCTCQISPKLVYNQRKALNIASTLLNGDSQSKDDAESQEVQMQKVLDAQFQQLPSPPSTGTSKPRLPHKVYLLTGSTGSLGSYLLDSLLTHPSAPKVICLNRPGGTASKQASTQRTRGLSEHLPSTRVTFLGGRLSKPHFGLSDEDYEILKETTHIVHNAWQVNFNLPLSAFKDQLDGCRQLIDLAHSTPHSVAVTFLSSIGAANHWPQTTPVPESMIENFTAAESGYGQSKLLAEHLFSSAHERFGIDVKICRLGQIAGPVNSKKGMWNKQEWFPSLLLSSKNLKKVPQSLGAMNTVDWIPVDRLADALTQDVLCCGDGGHGDSEDDEAEDSEQEAESDRVSTGSASPKSGTATPASMDTTATSSTPASSICSSNLEEDLSSSSKEKGSLDVLHFINPSTAQWSQDFAPHIQKLLGEDVALVAFEEWVEELSRHAEKDDGDVQDTLPAVKLVDFFQDIARADGKRPVFSLEQSLKESEGLQGLEAVSMEWLEHWWKQWTTS